MVNIMADNKPNQEQSKQQQVVNTAPTPKRYAVIVELGDVRGRSILFPPNQRVLRGKWSKSQVSHQSMSPELANMPDIPGLLIAVDTAQRAVGILDPLNQQTPDTKAQLAKLTEIYPQIMNQKGTPEKDVKLGKQTDSTLKTWLYWIRRLVDGRQATLHRGNLPKIEDIEAMPGEFIWNQFDMSSSKEIERTQKTLPYPYMVPEPEIAVQEKTTIDFDLIGDREDSGIVE